MALTGAHTYVGFGFGAIQSGLFLYEAFQSNAFGELIVAEVMVDVVEAVRQNSGFFSLNIAHADGVQPVQVGPVQMENPTTDSGRIIDAVARAHEIGTAVPSVNFYVTDSPGSIHRLLAAGLRQKAAEGGPRAVIYTAENNNHAAEILEAAVMGEIPEAERTAVRAVVQFLNTVIGKMSGVVADSAEIEAQRLARLTPQAQRAFLVEAFNRILISPIQFDPPFERGIAVFDEKADLLPFEEAKLYGHNAMHALAAYIGAARGLPLIADIMHEPGVWAFLRAAGVEESGAALIHKYSGMDPLFTPEGFAAYIDDLLQRMSNPYLRDTVERVGRDPARKLGWDDRLIGTMRLALRHHAPSKRYAVGAAAALALIEPGVLSGAVSVASVLRPLWSGVSAPPSEQDQVIAIVEEGSKTLRHWIMAGFPPLEDWISR
ncbi:MAG: hypothetical protein K8I30_16135 [Anaerolineae bacterium]|nr:hypothetical protein [Anaerolineae bacterium]